RRKMFEIDSVVNAMNFRGRIRPALAKKPPTVIGLSRDELRGSADLAKEFVAAAVFRKILPMRRDAERNARNFFQEKCSVRCAIGEVNVYMIDALTRKKGCEIQGIACALLWINPRHVFALMLLDHTA